MQKAKMMMAVVLAHASSFCVMVDMLMDGIALTLMASAFFISGYVGSNSEMSQQRRRNLDYMVAGLAVLSLAVSLITFFL